MNIYTRGVQFIQDSLNGQQNDKNNQDEQVCSDRVQSITTRCNDSQSYEKKMKKVEGRNIVTLLASY